MSKVTLFGQIIQRLDRPIFNKIAKKYQTDKSQKKLNILFYLIFMLFRHFFLINLNH
jgi:hypothetical protein